MYGARDDERGPTMHAACFSVGEHDYAVDIMQIKEIVNPVPITPVPKAPFFIEGIIELRGTFLPIIDLRKRFELPVTEPTRHSKYIIAAIDGRIVGLIVDRVRDVRHLELAQIREAPTLVVGGDARYFSGVVKQEHRILMVVDLAQILSEDERALLQSLDRAET